MQKKNNKETMKRVLKYIRKYTPALVLSLLLAGLTVLLTLYIPILTGNAVDLIIGKGQVDMAGIFPGGKIHCNQDLLHVQGAVRDQRRADFPD